MKTQDQIEKQLAVIRERGAQVANDRRQLERALSAIEEAGAAVRRTITEAAVRGRPLYISYLAHGDAKTPLLDGSYGPESLARQVAGLIAALFPGELERLLMARVEDLLAESGQEGISTEEREARLAALDSERRELELREEALIREANEQGIELDRRGDADPAVVLGLV